MVGEDGRHLLGGLEVFLLGVAQALGVVEVGVGADADQAVMGRTVLLAHEVHVIGGHYLDAQLLRYLEDHRIDLLLVLEGALLRPGHVGLVALHL